MDRSQIHPGLARARAADVARIPLSALKSMTPGEVPLRLQAYDVFVQKSRRPGLAPDLTRGYRQLAVEVLTTDDRARATELLKTAGLAPAYNPAELQEMLRAGTAVKLGNGHICAVGTVRDLRYFITIAQGAIGRKTPEDSAALRNLLVTRARFLGVPNLIPVNWGRPVEPGAAAAIVENAVRRAAAQGAGKSARVAKSTGGDLTAFPRVLIMRGIR
jgi:hypothetical protein